jgi:hypothetical protein
MENGCSTRTILKVAFRNALHCTVKFAFQNFAARFIFWPYKGIKFVYFDYLNNYSLFIRDAQIQKNALRNLFGPSEKHRKYSGLLHNFDSCVAIWYVVECGLFLGGVMCTHLL